MRIKQEIEKPECIWMKYLRMKQFLPIDFKIKKGEN